jgi:hypothetical protein
VKSADIKGYRELSGSDVEIINEIKEAEAELGNFWKEICSTEGGVDKRWASIAKTHFQEGFSALVRSIAQPEDVF